MDPGYDETMQALENFITKQKTQLANVYTDIAHLRRLRASALERPVEFLARIRTSGEGGLYRTDDDNDDKDGDGNGNGDYDGKGIVELEKLCEDVLDKTILKEINWSLFSKRDVSPMQNLVPQRPPSKPPYSLKDSNVHNQETGLPQLSPPPFPSPRTPSELQILVKNARSTLLDPILSHVVDSPLPPSDEEGPSESGNEFEINNYPRTSPNQCVTRSAQVGQHQRRRATRGVLGLLRPQPNSVPLDHDADGTQGDPNLYVAGRHEEDESDTGDVTMKMESYGSRNGEPPISLQDHHFTSGSVEKSTRARRPTMKARSSTRPPVSTKKAVPVSTPHSHSKVQRPQLVSRSTPGKNKSVTFKQAWSVEEQWFLEKLLEEIPDGEKNRWQKISRAMDGRRTPRQVASRVQKYFEKLKKFGVGEVIA